MSTLVEQLIQTEAHKSVFESAVRQLPLPVCAAFGSSSNPQPVGFTNTSRILSTKDSEGVREQFPRTVAASGNVVLASSGARSAAVHGKRVAVLFSGGPAAGGHNVVCGLKRVLGAGNTLFGVRAGPKGLLKGNLFEISDAHGDFIINTGGFDFLGSDRTKIKSAEQFAQVRETCIKYQLDAIVVVGGDDSNTNAAVLAESLFTGVKADGSGVQVIGVPKTIDGDLQISELLSISFGFDTATRIYSEMVGNILQDTSSSLKYWHFVKLMGRSASHVALEVALQTKPAIALISEEIAARQMSLASIIERIAQVIVERSHKGMNYGVLLAPEGLIEFIPEMNRMIAELNDVLAHHAGEFATLSDDAKPGFIGSKLSPANAGLLASLPSYIVRMLLAERDSHGNLQVSLIPTEQLLIDMARARVKEIDPNVPFAAHSHFLGYEGRCGAPTLFDAAYTFNLGLTAGSLILDGRTGYMATITGLTSGGTPQAIPLAGLLNIERRHGQNEFVIEKALVRMDSPAMQFFVSRRDEWAAGDCFASPGPRQFWGPTTHQLPISVALNSAAPSLMFKIG
ncbi:diphosphate--fructose-6-phosphate 1-phosphotransferase [Accumulibacter sp.]|uniref:diphosphate--fructose-6-phosphate 1-phosphotransferase n=3 Tax=Accumulibacter sp. TaxID=2053492 RepID=UPI00287ACE65|nr:diphosphate--fructose-6-phosphate 1-phosphotransferase [Accumulibacter sp.]MDS4055551.1 diphosphate--fructose-6-phosphate 1-phosphotransferase [Accumulibacter sp.]HMW62915.1 diphosphate--fructose-6-phosphate 1-phosphotransferase [Accumulibacter sp.]HMW78814.1 diphosphate--fructose-6-phosphate 1-phosphotransferase [Accumulibacter sp.]HMX68058.1 diphosphate--fructose-6-phosphate 1-phosphotransferase [Accumulibacter sp.]HNB67654.1 diphosphate--fructose-6-phosphate 1-phosphotransferase [Accumul